MTSQDKLSSCLCAALPWINDVRATNQLPEFWAWSEQSAERVGLSDQLIRALQVVQPVRANAAFWICFSLFSCQVKGNRMEAALHNNMKKAYRYLGLS